MSTALMRRGRDDRSGDGDSRYAWGEQHGDEGYPEERERLESSFDAVEGAGISDEADYDADLHNESGVTSADAVEGFELSENDDPAANPAAWEVHHASQDTEDYSGRDTGDGLPEHTSADEVEGAEVSKGDEADEADNAEDE